MERPVTSYMHRLFVVLDENTNVAYAVQQMNLNKAEVMVISKNGVGQLLIDIDRENKSLFGIRLDAGKLQHFSN